MTALDDAAELAVDLVLVSALSQVRAERIRGWIVVTITEHGDAEVRTDLCCVHHAGLSLRDEVGPDMALLPPCRNESG